jgi:hypothetical protein
MRSFIQPGRRVVAGLALCLGLGSGYAMAQTAGGATAPGAPGTALVPLCPDNPATLCLGDGRFSVTANWTKLDSTTGTATAVKLTDDSGYFWFFDAANIEVVVKVLNGCTITNAYWVFAAGLTNVQVNWVVTDLSNGAVFAQLNPQGTPFAPVQRTDAFPNSCP